MIHTTYSLQDKEGLFFALDKKPGTNV
jgi:hypothetical protein